MTDTDIRIKGHKGWRLKGFYYIFFVYLMRFFFASARGYFLLNPHSIFTYIYINIFFLLFDDDDHDDDGFFHSWILIKIFIAFFLIVSLNKKKRRKTNSFSCFLWDSHSIAIVIVVCKHTFFPWVISLTFYHKKDFFLILS